MMPLNLGDQAGELSILLLVVTDIDDCKVVSSPPCLYSKLLLYFCVRCILFSGWHEINRSLSTQHWQKTFFRPTAKDSRLKFCINANICNF